MMVFRQTKGHRYKLRVTDSEGRSATLSTGTDDKPTAEAIEQMVRRFARQITRRDVLTLLVDKRVKLADVFYHEEHGTLGEYLDKLSSPNLEPYVDEWKRSGASATYLRQLRTLMPEGKPYRASEFTRSRISAFLAGLPVSGPTRNRYKAALSVFARWLVEREIIPHNPVREVRGYAESDPNDVWLSWKDAQKVADAAEEPYRTLFAMMAGTGMEISAALKLTRADVELRERTIRVRGEKTRWRNRVVRAEPWVWPLLTKHVKRLVGAAPLFPGISRFAALYWFHEALEAAGLPRMKLHALRNTYAVNALKRGYRIQVVSHQLGHRDTSMVSRVYGRYLPKAEDYEVSDSTISATTLNKRQEVKRAR